MTPEQLIAEGVKLARRCVLLKAEGEALAGAWRGTPAAPGPGESFEHWLSVDCSFLPGAVKREGWLSVFSNEDDCETGAVTSATTAPASPETPLFAHEAQSLPPLDALFLLGPRAIQEWLKANDWEADWGYNDNFRDREVAGAYERAYQASNPLYGGGAHAVLGGWHMTWPDDDEYDPTKQIVLWTLAESEPWIEVWEADGQLVVRQRVT